MMNLWLFVVIIKALNLGRGANPKGYMVEEIWKVLAKAKYNEWERSSSQRSWELQSLKYVFLVIVSIVDQLCLNVLVINHSLLTTA
jgi:hypothetical protein